MSQNIQITAASLADYPVIQNMAILYVYDLSRQCGFISPDWALPADGLYQCFDLKAYFQEATRRAFLIRVDGELAGFVLLNQKGASAANVDWSINEFFILAKFQGKGVGKYVAQTIFTQHPGVWEVTIMPENSSALAFWQKTISAYMQQYHHYEKKLIRPGQAQPYRMVFNFDTRLKIQELTQSEPPTILDYIIDYHPEAQNDGIIRDGIIHFNKQILKENAKHWSIYVKSERQLIIGGALIWEHSDALYIDVLWVDDAYRGQGIGRNIMQKIENEAKNKGLGKLYVDTFSFQAEEFYTKQGFYRIAIVDDYLLGFDRCYMRKII